MLTISLSVSYLFEIPLLRILCLDLYPIFNWSVLLSPVVCLLFCLFCFVLCCVVLCCVVETRFPCVALAVLELTQ